ncbi:hypothetical protein [Cytobacillus praedii]|uniref:Uncharacterized protein n=1 Tax=Cytobacillus praedii TaxID=1742358 RepID=A0A4R1AU24_9BACI|nr:hypothetical protein [Cytobacillus praedii]TCJ01141.1 hypothetical protein E0Y62_25505 [Cytobacillus praedii]
MKILKLTDKVYNQYRENVRGNEHITLDQAVRKLSRNVQLVEEVAPERIKRHLLSVTYSYGNLDIRVLFGTIVSIINHKGEASDWKFPKRRYIELTKEYQIDDDKFNTKRTYNKR